jgi:superkiller protein 3
LLPAALLEAQPAAKPEELVKQAISLEQAGKWQEAKADYLQALAARPRYAEAAFALGKLDLDHYDSPDSIKTAIAHLEAARDNRYDIVQINRYLARARFRLGEYASAVELYRDAISRKPKLAELHLELARVLYDNGSYEEAMAEDSIALTLELTNRAALMLRGRILYRQRDYERAREEYRKILETNPDFPDVLEALAELSKSTQMDTAIHYYRRYLMLRPDDATANFNLSGLFYNLSQKDTVKPRDLPPKPADPKDTVALKNYDRQKDSLLARIRADHSESAFVYVGNAIRLGFGREDIYDFYLNVAQAAHQRAASITALRTFIESNPKDALKWALLGSVYADSGDVGQAITCYKEASGLDSTLRRRSFAWIAQQYYKQKQYDSAIAYYTKVIEIDPKAASAYFSRGYAYLQIQARVQGVADLEKGLSLDPKKIDPQVYLMTLYYQDKEYNRAYEMAKAILELSPGNEQAKAIKTNIEIMRAPKKKPQDEE